jgi:hypothetical protein
MLFSWPWRDVRGWSGGQIVAVVVTESVKLDSFVILAFKRGSFGQLMVSM